MGFRVSGLWGSGTGFEFTVVKSSVSNYCWSAGVSRLVVQVLGVRVELDAQGLRNCRGYVPAA